MRIFAFGCSLSQYFFPTWADILIFQHKNNGEVRKNKHVFYMPTQKDILALARSAGFILTSESEMKKIGYSNQYIYVLQKPE